MSELFGGSLSVRDAFSSTFAKFGGAISSANNGFNMFNQRIAESERANRRSMDNMQESITRLAQTYVSQGYTMSQAMSKATNEVSRLAPDSGSKWIDAFGKIKQSGTDAFGSVNDKVKTFSESSLGMITKLTAGYLTMTGAINGVKKSFQSASEIQNAGVMMKLAYGSNYAPKMNQATKYANETPWSETEVASGLARMKMLNLNDSQKSLTQMSDLGSIAKINKTGDLNSAIDAYSDMFNGEWMRMQTILGVKRTNLEDFAKQNGMKSFSNAKGQVTDKAELASVFTKYLDIKGISGATEEFGKTLTGRFSTLYGNLGSAVAGLVGVDKTGKVLDGSLFDKFGKGMDKFIGKINDFSNSPNFDKISNSISDIGGAISDGFGYLMDHPEIAEDLVKLSVGLWALGKVSSIITAFSTISSALSGSGFLAILAPIAPEIFAISGSLLALSSIVSPDGLLHKGISWLLGKIPFIGSDLQECFDEGSKVIYGFFSGVWDWIKEQFGFGTTKTDSKTSSPNNNWYDGKTNKSGNIDKDLQYKTVADMQRDGTITKSTANKTVTNKTDIHLNVDTIKETADVDEIMDTVTKRMEKYSQTRNNLE
jgi:hypothetical protein